MLYARSSFGRTNRNAAPRLRDPVGNMTRVLDAPEFERRCKAVDARMRELRKSGATTGLLTRGYFPGPTEVRDYVELGCGMPAPTVAHVGKGDILYMPGEFAVLDEVPDALFVFGPGVDDKTCARVLEVVSVEYESGDSEAVMDALRRLGRVPTGMTQQGVDTVTAYFQVGRDEAWIEKTTYVPAKMNADGTVHTPAVPGLVFPRCLEGGGYDINGDEFAFEPQVGMIVTITLAVLSGAERRTTPTVSYSAMLSADGELRVDAPFFVVIQQTALKTLISEEFTVRAGGNVKPSAVLRGRRPFGAPSGTHVENLGWETDAIPAIGAIRRYRIEAHEVERGTSLFRNKKTGAFALAEVVMDRTGKRIVSCFPGMEGWWLKRLCDGDGGGDDGGGDGDGEASDDSNDSNVSEEYGIAAEYTPEEEEQWRFYHKHHAVHDYLIEVGCGARSSHSVGSSRILSVHDLVLDHFSPGVGFDARGGVAGFLSYEARFTATARYRDVRRAFIHFGDHTLGDGVIVGRAVEPSAGARAAIDRDSSVVDALLLPCPDWKATVPTIGEIQLGDRVEIDATGTPWARAGWFGKFRGVIRVIRLHAGTVDVHLDAARDAVAVVHVGALGRATPACVARVGCAVLALVNLAERRTGVHCHGGAISALDGAYVAEKYGRTAMGLGDLVQTLSHDRAVHFQLKKIAARDTPWVERLVQSEGPSSVEPGEYIVALDSSPQHVIAVDTRRHRRVVIDCHPSYAAEIGLDSGDSLKELCRGTISRVFQVQERTRPQPGTRANKRRKRRGGDPARSGGGGG